MLSSGSEKDRICSGYTDADFIVGGEMEGCALYQFANIENVPGVVLKGICDWGAAKNGIYKIDSEELKHSKEEEDLKCGLQAYAMSKAVEKCAILLRDAELFAEPKHADIKTLLNEQKRSRIIIGSTAAILFIPFLYRYLDLRKKQFSGRLLYQAIAIECYAMAIIALILVGFLLFNSLRWRKIRDSLYNPDREIVEKHRNSVIGYRDLGNGYVEEITEKSNRLE